MTNMEKIAQREVNKGKAMTQLRLKFLPACVGLALAQMSGVTLADSGVGADNLIGNADNPGYAAGPVYRDPEMEVANRSPSGQLYEIPRLLGDVPPADGSVRGSVEVGLQVSSDQKRYVKLNEYSDPQNRGLTLNRFSIESDNAKDAFYFQLNGGGVGRDDQFYNLSVGKYNSWKLKGFYNETPHLFSSTWRPAFSHDGAGTLRPIQQFAANNAASLVPVLNGLSDEEIGLIRKKGGLRGDFNLTDNWKAYVSAARETRKGERPFASMGTVAIETFEPIDYTTDELMAGVSYVDKLNSFNLRAAASFFKNDISTLRTLAANNAPGALLTAGNTTVFDLAPNNQAYNVKAEYSRKFPELWKGKFSASYAWGSQRQDDQLQPWIDPTLAGPYGANVTASGGVGNWNGANGTSTSRSSSGQRIDTQLINLALTLNPLDDLSLKGQYRKYETKNKSGIYYSFNPLTGSWGEGTGGGISNNPVAVYYSSTGVAGGSCLVPPGFTAPAGCVGAAYANKTQDLMALPRDYKQTNYVLSADYSLNDTSSLEASFEREEFDRTYRERAETKEDKWKVGYVNRALADTTLRVSYENDRKRGSDYDALGGVNRNIGNWFAVYGPSVLGVSSYSRDALVTLIQRAGTTAGGFTYPTLAALYTGISNTGQQNSGGWMRHDQADRDQNIINARLNYQVQDNLDVGGYVQLKRVKYPSNGVSGMQRDDANAYNIDFNYQPSASWQLSGYFTRQDTKQQTLENYGAARTQAQVETICNGGAAFTNITLAANIDCVLGNLLNPALNVPVDTKGVNDTIGFALSKEIGTLLFTANYTWTQSKSSFSHSYVVPAQQLTEWPDITMRSNTLELGLAIPINKDTSARLMYRYDDFKLSDWHYPSTIGLNTAAAALSDYGPASFKVNTVGVFFNFKM